MIPRSGLLSTVPSFTAGHDEFHLPSTLRKYKGPPVPPHVQTGNELTNESKNNGGHYWTRERTACVCFKSSSTSHQMFRLLTE